jgi:hypothetical protein
VVTMHDGTYHHLYGGLEDESDDSTGADVGKHFKTDILQYATRVDAIRTTLDTGKSWVDARDEEKVMPMDVGLMQTRIEIFDVIALPDRQLWSMSYIVRILSGGSIRFPPTEPFINDNADTNFVPSDLSASTYSGGTGHVPSWGLAEANPETLGMQPQRSDKQQLQIDGLQSASWSVGPTGTYDTDGPYTEQYSNPDSLTADTDRLMPWEPTVVPVDEPEPSTNARPAQKKIGYLGQGDKLLFPGASDASFDGDDW